MTALAPVFTAAQLATIAGNVTAFSVQQAIQAQGAKGYRFTNLTGAVFNVYDQGGQLVDILPPFTFVSGTLDQPTMFLSVSFDPTKQGQSGAFTLVGSWQLWGYATAAAQSPDAQGTQ